LSILDARTLDRETTVTTDVCVAGAGAAGITLALQVARSGRKVCLVEGGAFEVEEETQSLHDLDCIGYPIRENFMSRARYYGGTCNTWAGRSMRLSEADFGARPWVPHSGWPIGENELAADYRNAARLLGLPDPEALGPMSEAETALFGDGPLAPTLSLWGKRPMKFGPVHRSLIRRSDDVQLILNANVTGLELSATGRTVDSLGAKTLEGQTLTLKARDFVLACGGLENARLLLVSRDLHSRGVGNQHDMVGRTFMDHPRAVYGRVRLEKPRDLPGLSGLPIRNGKVQYGIGIDAEVQEREELLNHYVTFEKSFSEYAEAGYQSFVRLMKILLRRGYAGKRTAVRRSGLARVPELIYLLTPKELMPHSLYRMHHALRRRLPPRANERERVVVYFCEQPPILDSRVVLAEERDRLGVNRLKLDWRPGGEVTRSVLRLQEMLRVELESRGIGTLEPGEGEPRYSDASHHMGTTRMSPDERLGVVDPNCRVHGVENLYMAGSSVFPSAGHCNPTWTIVALAVRLARHLSAPKVL